MGHFVRHFEWIERWIMGWLQIAILNTNIYSMFSLLPVAIRFYGFSISQHAVVNGQQLNVAPQFEFLRRNIKRFHFSSTCYTFENWKIYYVERDFFSFLIFEMWKGREFNWSMMFWIFGCGWSLSSLFIEYNFKSESIFQWLIHTFRFFSYGNDCMPS